MMNRSRKQVIRLTALALLLSAGSCAHPISRQLREESKRENLTFARVFENPAAYTGRTVLWGGQIIETTNFNDGAEMIVLETPLSFMGEPGAAQSSRGRIIAKSAVFLDPAIYKADREVTLAGEVIGAQERTLDKTTYTYPVVRIEELYLWERYYYQPYPDTYRYDPFWGPYYFGPRPFYPFYQAVEKRPSAALRSSLVTAAYAEVRLIPRNFARLASGPF